MLKGSANSKTRDNSAGRFTINAYASRSRTSVKLTKLARSGVTVKAAAPRTTFYKQQLLY